MTGQDRIDTVAPRVSVIMAVHNGMPYVESALRSVMDQTLREIEIIVIDDASRDETPAVLARLAAGDPRLRIITLATNLRLPRALNEGLAVARAPYAARMDADDIAMPDRLAVQIRYMDEHPDVVLIGASMQQIDQAGRLIRTSRRARDAAGVRWLARFNMPLVHPTFMFRRFAADGGFQRYRPESGVAEDYDFVARALTCGDAVSLPDVLLQYRVHAGSISGKNWRTQQQIAHDIALQVQTADLPPAVVAALAPLRAAYFGMERVPAAAIFAGLRAMLAHDRAAYSSHAAWMRRQAAQIAEAALTRSGAGRAEVIGAFLGPGRDFLPALVLRLMEIRRLLPAALRSEPST